VCTVLTLSGLRSRGCHAVDKGLKALVKVIYNKEGRGLPENNLSKRLAFSAILLCFFLAVRPGKSALRGKEPPRPLCNLFLHSPWNKEVNLIMVKIRLRRMGAKKAPFYRIVVADSRYPRDGRFIEEIGTYNPMSADAEVKINSERAQQWIKNGAQPTDTVRDILKKAGVL